MTDGAMSYTLAIAVMREMRIRAGAIAPRSDDERRWAAEGARDVQQLDTVRS